MSPAVKKGDMFDKSNYRPISILLVISKMFERLIFYQINNYIDPYLSIYQCGFRKHECSKLLTIYDRELEKLS